MDQKSNLKQNTYTNLIVYVKPLEHLGSLPLPSYQSLMSAGADLRAAINEDQDSILKPGERMLIPTGLTLALPEGYEAQIRPRSGLAYKYGLTCLNTPGTIDADYRGEIKVLLINHGQNSFTIKRGERIAQMVVAPIVQIQFQTVETLEDTKRGEEGFGSTGVR